MELVGGLMIMLILLGLITGAVLLSLPILVWGLHRRVAASLTTLEQLEEKIIHLERCISQHSIPVTQPAGVLDTASGGVDDTAER
jgi:hypothetical protein